MADAKKTEKDKSGDARPEPDKDRKDKDRKKDGTRETIESIVIAFIFAFLFRTFEAEAFVIPTGSMAPTLLGRHKDETCPKCGYEWAIGASEELDQTTGLLERRIDRAVCPNCRSRVDVRNDPVFVGDRILVTKFNYEVGDPDRFDVAVFKFPEDPTTNYIKRLCGLPGESIEIRQGDLYAIRDGKTEILRKQSGAKQLAVMQPVYDDRYPALELLEAGWPERWAGVVRDNGPEAVAGWSIEADGWQSDAEARSYRLEAGDRQHWLRYRNFAPTGEDWRDVGTGALNPKARLILDFCGYNAFRFEHHPSPEEGAYWVGDLAVTANVDLEQARPGGMLVLELVEGSRRYRCTLDPNAGTATLSYVDSLDPAQRDAAAKVLDQTEVDFEAGNDYEIAFANVDDRLWLWIDGNAVPFESPNYEPFAGQLVQRPTADDLTPVGIAGEGLTATVSALRIHRDIYYRAEFLDPAVASLPDNQRSGGAIKEAGSEQAERQLYDLADDPDAYADFYVRSTPWLAPDRGAQYQLMLGEDEFLLLGDNSPRSLDGRLWGNRRRDLHRHAVPREALVGKALLIFWPHGLRLGNTDENGTPHGWTIRGLEGFFYHRARDGSIVADYPAHGVPFYPNFERILRRIR